MNSWRSVEQDRLVGAGLLILAVIVACGGNEEHGMDHTGHAGMPGMEMPPTARSLPADTGLEAILRSPNSFVVADLTTVTLQERELPMDFDASGTIAYDPRSVHVVPARAAGWIEKLHVKYRYQPVRKGQPLMNLYSRELVTEQENFLLLLRQGPDDAVMIAAAGKRLSLLGLTDAQIATLRSSGQVQRAITYYAPYTGHLHGTDDASSMATGSIAGGAEGAPLSLREGAYVEKGQTLFSIYGTDPVLVQLDVHPAVGQDRIATGQAVTMRIDGPGGGVRDGRVDLVEPVYRSGSALVTVRTYLPDPGDTLHIGSRVSAVIHTGTRTAMAVPSSAVVSTGLRWFVFVREDGGFRARPVTVGARAGDWIEVRDGLGPAEAIARNAQLLIDSEGSINTPRP